VPDRRSLERLMARRAIVAPKGPPGSAVLFDCNLMHASAGNLSAEDRVNLFVVYNSMENRLEAPFSALAPRPGFLAERRPLPLP
jgi:ectoine hydroxylase